MRITAVFACALVSLLLVMAPCRAQESTVDEKVAKAGTVSAGNLDFSLRLFHRLATATPGQNIVISPLSISQALSMACNGAAGETQSEMMQTLGFRKLSLDAVNAGQSALLDLSLNPGSGVTLNIANALWLQHDHLFVPDYLQRMQQSYHAQLTKTDLHAPATVDMINNWASDQTHGMIKYVISPGDIKTNTELLLTNAVYFKGIWSMQFDKANTRSDNFTLQNGTTAPVSMMNQTARFQYWETREMQSISLPYGADERFCFLIFLPRQGYSLPDIFRQLDSNNWNYEWKLCQIKLPRFSTNYQTKLVPPLTDLGMQKAFIPGLADFAGMTGIRGDLYLDAVLHITRLEVDEEGTRATAVTAITGGSIGIPRPPKIIPVIVDHPFYFALYDSTTDAILFMGQIVDPR